MSKKQGQPSSETDELFRQAMQDVTPLPASDRIISSIKPAYPSAGRKTVQTNTAKTDPFSDHGAKDIPPTSFIRSGLNSMTLRKLRRGYWPVQDAIDLHGNTLEQARAALYSFLQHAVAQHYRCVNIIHGKGWQTGGNEGVLKIHTRHWLPQFPEVMAFCEPPLNAGGGGAVWVLLKAAGKLEID